ncbi:MAG: phosphopentomutase [Alphaproteobacteria bacterium]|nr:phosphopentomutase [Alphaproteobacteria bacterium]
MTRAFLMVMDSFGIGTCEDSKEFGDEGANTLGHIARAYHQSLGSSEDYQFLPVLEAYGLGLVAQNATGILPQGFIKNPQIYGAYGYAQEISLGKDTPSGHWEMAGLPVMTKWGYFPNPQKSFPDTLIHKIISQGNLSGILGNCHASGTTIIEELGLEHIRTKKPIIYTSADSVLQIAAHEDFFGLNRLYDLCSLVRKIVDQYNIGRVIARPFIGTEGHFQRTGNRRDYTTPPYKPTLLDKLTEHGHQVIGIGKISDIFAHRGVSKKIKADGNDNLFLATQTMQAEAPDRSLIFTNFVDFDTLYGHRRDPIGYAHALKKFDIHLKKFIQKMEPDDLAIITADHGCDPTFRGSDHTREYLPILIFGPKVKAINIGKRQSLADIGQTLASFFKIEPLEFGRCFFKEIIT